MSLTGSAEILKKAQEGHYAVGAFNAENMEMVQAIIDAAEEMNSPVIIQTTPGTIKYADTDLFRAMVSARAKDSKVPVALHLDHGDSYELCGRAVASGYTSVMIDGSKLPYEQNIELSRRVVELASGAGVPVEAELGTVGGKEDSKTVADRDVLYTDPGQARDFARQTGVQSLAVAIGTAHGFYKGEPKLDFGRLKEIRQVVPIPLVLHGASGLPDSAVKQAVGLGICKVNFATELRVAFTKGVRSVLDSDAKVYDPKKYNASGREEVKKLVIHKIRVCGSEGKA
ncbi:MAG TPA: fructose-1,6-bisphosphate aldolase, class II [Ruminococcaceae bacterium]|jgi:tagatose 1,6-diphosphate aldolase GatY/KbaY|nr:fructose-1,6-bisphosphate aldolase, class II [Oscillospiraceae bacterium]